MSIGRGIDMRVIVQNLLVLITIHISINCNKEENSELPSGWEGAQKIDAYIGPCKDSLYPKGIPGAKLVDGRIRVSIAGITYDCVHNLALSVYVQVQSDGYHVLVQPTDMHPDTEVYCVCSNTIRFYLDGDVDDNITFYTRDDADMEEDPPVRRVTSIKVTELSDDCRGLFPCVSDNDCPVPKDPKEVESHFGKNRCTKIPSCGGDYCIWKREVCLMECNQEDCIVSESVPADVTCK